jgi:flagellar basal-body rod modification protein FlgD
MSTSAAGSSISQSLSMDDFIQLFLAQVQNQDPLEPMDSSDFTAQLAQYSQVSGIEQMNKNLETLISSQTTNQNAMAVSYLGKDVIIAGNGFNVKDDVSEYEFDYVLGADASDVQVFIEDEDGNTVAILDQGEQEAGRSSFTWNGKDSEGVEAPPGKYTFTVSAKDLDGEDVSVQEFTRGTVTGVGYDGGSALFEVNGDMVTLADIVKVYDKES